MFPPRFPDGRGFSMKLTSANVALPKGKSDHIVFDDRLRGFGLRVRRLSGDRIARNWIIQYRQHGRGRRMIIGDAEKITPAQARDKAKKELAKVELGGDPQADKRERREKDSLNLRGVIAGFIAAKARSVKPSTLTALKRYLEGPLYIRPLHSMPVDKITRKDIRLVDAGGTRREQSVDRRTQARQTAFARSRVD
jgi:hypothetical protein